MYRILKIKNENENKHLYIPRYVLYIVLNHILSNNNNFVLLTYPTIIHRMKHITLIVQNI